MDPSPGQRNVLKRVSAGTAMLATVVSLVTSATAAEIPPPRPNIIFIMLDDMGYGDVPTYGQQHIQMPNLDNMGQEGIRYTNVYTGSPICAPTRSSLMTGQHTGHTRVRGNFPATDGEGAVVAFNGGLRQPLLEEDRTVAEVLKEAGYVTGITGKWGLGEPGTPGVPNAKGFDEWYGILNQRQAHSYYPAFIWRNQEKITLKGNTGTSKKFVTQKQYVHDMFTGFALDFVREHGPKDDPFFLYLAYTVPHASWQIPELEPYTQGRGWTREQQVYASMLTRADRDIGELFSLLKELNIDEETIVFFCSDNGAQNRYDGVFDSSGPLSGRKRSMYDGGLRTVMMVRWPGRIAANAVSGDIWYFPDVLPTLAELAGANPPPGIDGVSVVPSLLSQPQPELFERPLYWEDHEKGFRQAIRLGDWKAVRNGHNTPIELYNLAEDIGEENNIAAQHPDVVADMEARFLSMRTPSSGWPTPLDPR
jgi:arylsulfatase A-like enzyme